MGQIGHTPAEFPLAVDTDVGDRKHPANARLDELRLGADEGVQWALNGHYGHDQAAKANGGPSGEEPQVGDTQALPEWRPTARNRAGDPGSYPTVFLLTFSLENRGMELGGLEPATF